MAIVRNGEIVEDRWRLLGDAEEMPLEGPVIVSLERWQNDRDRLMGRNRPLGIRLRSDQSPRAIAGDVHRFDLVALEFPAFTDGRSYSHARLLRERLGYRGELRAVGNVLRDQYLFMRRCGFDSFEVADGRGADDWRDAVSEISVHYQPAADGTATRAA